MFLSLRYLCKLLWFSLVSLVVTMNLLDYLETQWQMVAWFFVVVVSFIDIMEIDKIFIKEKSKSDNTRNVSESSIK